jgi:hypothetical protein
MPILKRAAARGAGWTARRGVCPPLGPSGELTPVQFSRELRAGVASGDITVSFRRWKRPQVKVGNRYAVEGVEIEIDSLELVPFSSVSRADVRRSGELDRESLRSRAAHSGPITDETLVYRIDFHVV